MEIVRINSEYQNQSAILFNGVLRNSESGGQYKTAVFFDNDITLSEDNINSFADINCEEFTSNEVSFSFWINPLKKSANNSTIILNGGDYETGLVYNSSGDEGVIGVKWNQNKLSSPTNFTFKIEQEAWTHLVVIINKSGIVNICGNGKYLGFVDLKHKLPKVDFNNVYMGGFCGMLDNLKIYSYALDYGNVAMGQTAKNNAAYLFKVNRITGNIDSINDISENSISNIYYLQPDFYVEAYKNYLLEKRYENTYYDQKSMFEISGGINNGKLGLATGDFRTLPGIIKSI